MRILFSLATALLLLLLTPTSWALGLGDISVDSKLGENFSASVAISDSSTLNTQQIIANNAPVEIYQQLKVDNSFIYQGFKLSIVEVDGSLRLDIKSREPIREPYLNFVIQLKWPEGQINKEFKVFIDP